MVDSYRWCYIFTLDVASANLNLRSFYHVQHTHLYHLDILIFLLLLEDLIASSQTENVS